MAEDKKRFRPTLTEYRAKEKECDEMRSLYYGAMKEKEEMKAQRDSFKLKKVTLEKSNRMMEEELKKLREDKERDSLVIKQLSEELKQQKHPGFWARIFHRKEH